MEVYVKEIFRNIMYIKWLLLLIMANLGFILIFSIKRAYAKMKMINELIKTLVFTWALAIICILIIFL